MGLEDVLSPAEPAEQGESAVKNENRDDQNEGCHICSELCEADNQQSKKESEKQAARISHEGSSAGKVQEHETETTSSQKQAEQCDAVSSVLEGQQKESNPVDDPRAP